MRDQGGSRRAELAALPTTGRWVAVVHSGEAADPSSDAAGLSQCDRASVPETVATAVGPKASSIVDQSVPGCLRSARTSDGIRQVMQESHCEAPTHDMAVRSRLRAGLTSYV